MNEMKIFNNPEFGEIRTIEENGVPLFCGSDVARALGYQNPSRDVQRHCKKAISRCTTDSVGRQQEMLFIPESDLYRLVFCSKLPTAEKFTDWVTSEVLPSVRKHGAYMTPETLQAAILNPDYLLQVVTALKNETDRRKALEVVNAQLTVDNQTMQPKALFADSVAASGNTVLVGELAKILRQNGVDMGEKRLFAWLRDNGYLIKRKGTDYNMPTQKSMEQGLFRIKETVISHSDGHTSVSKTPKITGKGQQYFINIFITKK